MTSSNTLRLGLLSKHQAARILKVHGSEKGDESDIVHQLLDMGFTEGTEVKILHEAPYIHDPIAVLVRGTIVALRRSEANFIEVQVL